MRRNIPAAISLRLFAAVGILALLIAFLSVPNVSAAGLTRPVGTASLAAPKQKIPQLAWVHESGSAGLDFAGGGAVDKDGSIYLTSEFVTNNPDDSYSYLRKYRPDGTEIWTRQVGGSGAGLGRISLDQQGHIYVSETRIYAGLSHEAFLLKFDRHGYQLWNVGVTAGGDCLVTGAATDRDDSVYVAGNVKAGPAWYQIFLGKFNPDGHQVWLRVLDTLGFAQVPALSLDAGGNVLLGGQLTPIGAAPTAFIAKCNSSGDVLWVRELGAGIMDGLIDIATDSLGRVYGVGYIQRSSPPGLASAVVRLDGDGTGLSAFNFAASSDEAETVSVDSKDNFYVGASTQGLFPNIPSLGGNGLVVRKYDKDMQEQWSFQFGSAGDFLSGISGDNKQIVVAGNAVASIFGQVFGGQTDGFLAGFSLEPPGKVK
jgi:hypothetical protein